MYSTLLSVHVLVALALVGLVLLQRGKGADMGAAFGSGASNTVFGSQGASSFLTRMTALLATVFFVTSLSLGYFADSGQEAARSVTETVPAQESADSKPSPEDTEQEPDRPTGPADVPQVPD